MIRSTDLIITNTIPSIVDQSALPTDAYNGQVSIYHNGMYVFSDGYWYDATIDIALPPIIQYDINDLRGKVAMLEAELELMQIVSDEYEELLSDPMIKSIITELIMTVKLRNKK